MGGSKRILLPLAEHRQAKVCDSTSEVDESGVAAGSLQKRSSRNVGRVRSKVVRPLVKLKDALVELVASSGDPSPRHHGSSVYVPTAGVIMGPVDFGGYEAASYYSARNYYDSNYS